MLPLELACALLGVHSIVLPLSQYFPVPSLLSRSAEDGAVRKCFRLQKCRVPIAAIKEAIMQRICGCLESGGS